MGIGEQYELEKYGEILPETKSFSKSHFNKFWDKNKIKIKDAVQDNSHTIIFQLFEKCWYKGFEACNNATH